MLIEGKKMVCTDLSGCTWLRKSVGANINRNCLFQPLSSSLYLPMMYIVLPYFWLFVCWAIWLENRVFLGLIGCKNFSTCTKVIDAKYSKHRSYTVARTIECVCHSIGSMFRVLGIYNFGARIRILATYQT